METQIVDTTESLAALCESLQGQTRIGLDTEFHAERRYKPELMLLQLALEDGRSWIVDPLKVSLEPLGPILDSATWVCHGSIQDIALLHRATGCRPNSLVDTQILAAMCHMRFPIGLASLTDKMLGHTLSKCPALSDWSRRPLTETQRRYAAMDAKVVLELRTRLLERLPGPDYVPWVEEAGQDLVDRALAENDPDRSWKGLEIASRLDEPTRRVLHHLHVWRDGQARAKDQPPHYVISDGMVLQIARNRPRDLEEMGANRRLSSGLVRRHGTDIMRCIAEGLEDRSPAPKVATEPQRRNARMLMVWAEVMGPELGIAAGLLLPWELALRVVQRPRQFWNGWRQEATGDALNAFMSGQIRLQMGRKGPRLV